MCELQRRTCKIRFISGNTELFARRFETLYRLDERGRLTATNEWTNRVAPRLHVMMSGGEVVWRFRADQSEEVVSELEAVLPQLAPGSVSALHEDVVRILDRYSTVESVSCGPAFTRTTPIMGEHLSLRIEMGESELLRQHLGDWVADVPHCQPMFASFEGGSAVSVCASVRISQWIQCAGVETHPAFRKLGHAASAVAAWANQVLGIGAQPFYSTSWENEGSQAVARRLGFERVCVDFSVL